MSFYDRLGHLSTGEADIKYLIDMTKNISNEDIIKVDDLNLTLRERYTYIRLARQIEGLQMVIFLNGGVQPVTHFLMLFDRKAYLRRGQKL